MGLYSKSNIITRFVPKVSDLCIYPWTSFCGKQTFSIQGEIFLLSGTIQQLQSATIRSCVSDVNSKRRISLIHLILFKIFSILSNNQKLHGIISRLYDSWRSQTMFVKRNVFSKKNLKSGEMNEQVKYNARNFQRSLRLLTEAT